MDTLTNTTLATLKAHSARLLKVTAALSVAETPTQAYDAIRYIEHTAEVLSEVACQFDLSEVGYTQITPDVYRKSFTPLAEVEEIGALTLRSGGLLL